MALISIAGIVGSGAVAYSTIKRLEKNDDNKELRIRDLERWAIKHGYEPED